MFTLWIHPDGRPRVNNDGGRRFADFTAEKVMDKDRVEGSAKQVKGAVKEAVGQVVGDAKGVRGQS
jgi:hypothetical protein